MESGKWIVWADVRTDACMLLNILPDISRAVTKYKPDRILTTVPINRKSSLILIEYLYPFRIRLSLSGKEEVLFAKAVVRSGSHAGNVLDFYMELHTMQKNSVLARFIFLDVMKKRETALTCCSSDISVVRQTDYAISRV